MMREKLNMDRRMVAGLVGAAATLAFAAGSISAANAASTTTTTTRTTVTRVRTARLSPADRNFMNAAAQGGAMEVALGKFAQSNGGSATVRSFGRRMEIDHRRINHDLANTARAVGIPLEWRPNDADRATLGRLANLHGAAFDRAYTADMVRDHQKDVAAFEREASRGRNSQIRAFAVRTVPTLRDHLQMAQAMQAGRPFAHRMTTITKTTTTTTRTTRPMNNSNTDTHTNPNGSMTPNNSTPPSSSTTTP